MFLTLLSISADLSAFTWRENGQVNQINYTHALLRHRLFSGASLVTLKGFYTGSLAWNELFSAAGYVAKTPAVDGVHEFTLQMGKYVEGANVLSDGTLVMDGEVSLDKVTHVSTGQGLFEPVPLVNGKVALAPTEEAINVVLWEAPDYNRCLVMYAAEKALAAQLRQRATLSCEAVKALLPRYLDLLSATQRFNCQDYQGADWLVGADPSTSNCGCS